MNRTSASHRQGAVDQACDDGDAGESIATADAVSRLYLHPGQMFVSTEPTSVTTILGSCVAVCLWDSRCRIGGINHYLLPYGVDGPAGLRYGNVALKRLLRRLIDLGGRKSDICAKLFGGACVIDAFRGKESHLGVKNTRVAREFLADERISIASEDLGGDRGRKIVFQTHDGVAWVKKL